MKTTKLHIKNMVCPRCVSSVESILKSQNISFSNVSLGEINLTKPINLLQRSELSKELERVGFEIIETKLNSIIEKIKLSVTAYINNHYCSTVTKTNSIG
jgi:copper chaperone CopZ